MFHVATLAGACKGGPHTGADGPHVHVGSEAGRGWSPPVGVAACGGGAAVAAVCGAGAACGTGTVVGSSAGV